MDPTKEPREEKSGKKLQQEASIDGEAPDRNRSEPADIEQTRIENRREADLDDKTPAGDGGPEDEIAETDNAESPY